MTTVVIDASALVDGLLKSEVALPTESMWHAPHLLDAEIASALRGKALTGGMTASDAREALEIFLGFRIRRHSMRRLLPRVWALRENVTAYDASYVALAESLGVPLVTTDLRLARTAARYCDVITP